MNPSKPNLRGQFVTFEGIDGCGKSTQARLLAEHIRALGLTVLETREPGGTLIGKQIRSVLLAEKNSALEPMSELLLYLADRVQHLSEVVKPALSRGETVICDRFHDATLAYQKFGRGLNLSLLEPYIEAEVLTATPQTTFWLDLAVADAQERIAGRNREKAGGKDSGDPAGEGRFDSARLSFHERVRKGYQALHQGFPKRIERIDAAGTVAAIAEEIRDRLERRYDVV